MRKDVLNPVFVLFMVCFLDSAFAEEMAKLFKHASPIAEMLIPLVTCMLLTSVFKSAYATSSSENTEGIHIIRATFSTIGKKIGRALMRLELCIERPTVKLFRKFRKIFSKVLPMKASEMLSIFLISIILTAII